MIQPISFTRPLNEYDDFVLCHSFKNDSWMLIGEWNTCDVNHMHYIASSDSEEELRMWIDLRNITLKKVIECECLSFKSIRKHIK